jgi:flagellar protein FlbD
MINVSRLNGVEFFVNDEMIETMEQSPDTVVTMSNGHKYIVKETIEELLERIIAFRKRYHSITENN